MDHALLALHLAAAFLSGYIAFKEQGDWRVVVRRFGWPSLGIAVTFAAGMISFITALYETTVANVLFIQATAPFFAALGASCASGYLFAP